MKGKFINLKYDEIGGLCIIEKNAMDRFLQELMKFQIVAKKTKRRKSRK